MKRKWAAYAGTAYNAYKHAKRLYTGVKRIAPRRIAPSNAAVTVQKDIRNKRSRKSNKKLLKRKNNFRLKIQKALEPTTTHHTYTEVMSVADIITKPGATNPIQEQYITSSGGLAYALNAGGANTAGLTYCRDVLHGLFLQSSGVVTGAQIETKTPQKDIQVLSSTLDISLTNPSTIAMVYDVYWCVAVMDISDASYATPRLAWEKLLLNNEYMTAGSATRTTVLQNGIKPKDAVGFGKYWKILQEKRIYLNAGATSEMTFNGGSFFAKESVFGGGKSAVKGLTKCAMIVGGIGDNSGLAIGNNVMRVVTTRKYRVCYKLLGDQAPGLPTNTTRIV